MNIIFFGTSEFATEPLKYLFRNNINIACVVTKPDNIKIKSKKHPIKNIAEKLKLCIFQPKDINSEDSVEYLKSFNPDFIVIASYGLIVPKKILRISKIETLNIHPSLLPKYRGAAPIERAIINNEKITGITIMKVGEGLDTGPIYLQKKINISKNITSEELSKILSKMSGKILLEAIDGIQRKILKIKLQNNKLATYAEKVRKSEGKISFNKKGFEIINKIRALPPRVIPYINFNNSNLGVYKAKSVISKKILGDYGSIIKIDKKEGILVKCLDGYIVIQEVKPQNKKRMLAKCFINGLKE